MRSHACNLLTTLVFGAALAAALPAVATEPAARAGEGQPTANARPAADGASCRPPGPGEPAPVAPRADLAPEWARLGAEARQAEANGVHPLNTRGYNYASGGPDSAALGFEVRGR